MDFLFEKAVAGFTLGVLCVFAIIFI